MATKLNNINSFILNHYVDIVNNFVGEKIINNFDEKTATELHEDMFKFFEKLSFKIQESNCSRKCPFRKGI